jgi:uncharacterized protein YecT (DUF1311 family)
MMHRGMPAFGLALGMALAPDWVAAQSFDCTKARSPVERAICASPALREQDAALAAVYSKILTQAAARAPDITREQRQWLADRTRSCAPTPAPTPPPAPATPNTRPAPAAPAPANDPANAPAASIPCLEAMYRARLAALTAESARLAAAALPTERPRPVATLARDAVPAAGASDVRLEVREAGRFAISAESATGVSLQLADMMQGPGEVEGEPGIRDGRLDGLLDVGTYKLRLAGSPQGQGEAKLKVAPFAEVEGASSGLLQGGRISTSLSDLQQRSYWIEVQKPGRVVVEAAGRGLQDLRLWRNGTDLAEVAPRMRIVEPKSGQPLTSARLDGTVEPGVYLVTAYGGPPLVWTGGATGQPVHVQVGAPEELAGGWAEATIGPLGTARFALPPAATYLRADIAEPTALRMAVTRNGSNVASAEITRRSREPVASLRVEPGEGRVVEIAGAEGQRFRLRALAPAVSRSISGTGSHWIAVDVAGESADELPATAVLARLGVPGSPTTVLAANAPKIGATQGWRRKFNLRGPSNVLFEVLGPTPVAVRTEGVGTKVAVEPLLGQQAPRADGRAPNRWELEPGWYNLKIEGVNGAVGVVDLTLGPSGLAVEAPKPVPGRAVIPLGLHGLVKDASYLLLLNAAPALVAAPVVRSLPAALANGPLTVFQNPGQVLDISLRLPKTGNWSAVEPNGAPVSPTVLAEIPDETGRSVAVRIPAVDRARAVTLAWREAPSGEGVRLEMNQSFPVVRAGKPAFFDLPRDGARSFALEVPEGGLYRVETLGRLRTKASINTAFLPQIEEAQANGGGENALLQTYLRAGRYRVAVSALDSTGRAGLSATPAPLPEGDRLIPDGTARATLEGGRGVVFPIDIAQGGTYRLELLGLGRTFTARLEDAEGWPLTKPGEIAELEQHFAPGRYRLVVLPQPVDARVVARLLPVQPEIEVAGHGPHPLPFEVPQVHQWREPQGQSDPRVPDRWTFGLQGPAEVTLDIGDGMIADLLRESFGPVAKIAHKNGFSGRLEPGRYVVEARSLGRNDRLDYEIALRSKEIQPGEPRFVTLPVTIPFALAEDRVVSLTTLGEIDVRAVLRDGEGRVIERVDDRTDDWNVALSRRLPAGRYDLELTAVPQPGLPVPEETAQPEPEPAAEESAEESAEAPPEGEEPSDHAEADAEDTVREDEVEVVFALPEPEDAGALAYGNPKQVTGAKVHRLMLPAAGAGSLVVVGARSRTEIVASLERQAPDGSWSVIGLDRGKAPVVAAPADGTPWRAAVWPVDQEPAQIIVTAQNATGTAQALGEIRLETVALPGLDRPAKAALVAVPGSALVTLADSVPGLREGSSPARGLSELSGSVVVPQTERLWLLMLGNADRLTLRPASATAGPSFLTLQPGATATIPDAPLPVGKLRLWRAESSFGIPGLEAGRGMGVARGGSLALSGGSPVRLWNAESNEALRVTLSPAEVDLLEGREAESESSRVLASAAALPLRLPPGAKRLILALPPRTAAVAGWKGASPVTVWAGPEAQNRSLEGVWTDLLLVNLGNEPAPISTALVPLAGEPERLAAGRVFKRFVGSAGSSVLPAEAAPGDRLVVAGASARFVGRDGRLSEGTTLTLSGPGEVVLRHEAGLVAAWIERPGTPAWPVAEPRSVTPPQALALEGETMALNLDSPSPQLVHLRSTGPLIASVRQGGVETDPALFPSGAEFHRYLAAGPAEIRLFSPHDGPLSGRLALTSTPVTPTREGQGDPVAVAPGGTALFGFEVTRAGKVGVGIRAEPDQAVVRLLDGAGRQVGEGAVQLQRLEPGRYIIEARVPAEGVTATVRPTVLGVSPPPAGPPPEITQKYLELVGLGPAKAR